MENLLLGAYDFALQSERRPNPAVTSLLRELGVEPRGQRRFLLADSRWVDMASRRHSLIVQPSSFTACCTCSAISGTKEKVMAFLFLGISSQPLWQYKVMP